MGNDVRPRTFRPVPPIAAGLLTLAAVTVFAAWLTIAYLEADRYRAGAAVVAGSVAAGATLYGLLVRPRLRLTDDALIVVNPLRTTVIPWGSLRGARGGMVLVFSTENGPVRSWVTAGGSQSWSTGRAIRADYPLGGAFHPASGSGPATLEALGGMPLRGVSTATRAQLLVEEWWTERPNRSADPVQARWHARWLLLVGACTTAAALLGAGAG